MPADGSFRLKEVLKALSEDGHTVRESQFREINALAVADGQSAPLEIDSGSIRLRDIDPPEAEWDDSPPPLLYGFCRRRAHKHVFQRGLGRADGPPLVLARDRDMALRLGRRIDPDPLIIVVEAARAAEQGQPFFRLGEALFQTDELPPRLLQVPPLPKEREDETGKSKPAARDHRPTGHTPPPGGPRMPRPETMPGSFLMTADPEEKKREKRKRDKSKKQWQQDRRKKRRGKD